MRKIFALFAALCLIAFAVPLALAQDAAAVSRSSWLFDIWTIVQPIVVVVVSIVGPTLGTWIAIRLVSLLKITDDNQRKEMEKRIRDALHAAAFNGLKYAMARAGLPAGVVPGSDVIADAIDYIRSKSPDTAAQAGANDEDLAQIVMSKVLDLNAMLTPAPAK